MDAFETIYNQDRCQIGFQTFSKYVISMMDNAGIERKYWSSSKQMPKFCRALLGAVFLPIDLCKQTWQHIFDTVSTSIMEPNLNEQIKQFIENFSKLMMNVSFDRI